MQVYQQQQNRITARLTAVFSVWVYSKLEMEMEKRKEKKKNLFKFLFLLLDKFGHVEFIILTFSLYFPGTFFSKHTLTVKVLLYYILY